MAAFAGVEMIFSLSGKDGTQYVSLKFDGEEMVMNQTYRVASLRGAVAKYDIVEEYRELTFSDLFKSYLETQNGTVTAPEQLVKQK